MGRGISYSPDWPSTPFIAKDALELLIHPASTSPVLGLQEDTNTLSMCGIGEGTNPSYYHSQASAFLLSFCVLALMHSSC